MPILMKEKDEPCGAMKIVAAAANCVGKESTVIMVNMKPKLILWGGISQANKTRKCFLKNNNSALMRRIDINLYVDNVVYLN